MKTLPEAGSERGGMGTDTGGIPGNVILAMLGRPTGGGTPDTESKHQI